MNPFVIAVVAEVPAANATRQAASVHQADVRIGAAANSRSIVLRDRPVLAQRRA